MKIRVPYSENCENCENCENLLYYSDMGTMKQDNVES